MQPKGIRVFSVSARAYTQNKNRLRKEDHTIDAETAGIDALRHFLAKLSAKTNYQNFYGHVHEVLTTFRNQAARPLEQHAEDKTYAAMRRDLKTQIPLLRNELKNLVSSPLQSLVAKPWSATEEPDVIYKIQGLVEHVWIHPRIYFPGFANMLPHNGIPVSGKYLGHNLNYDLLGTMKRYHDKWYNTMNDRIEEFAQSLRRWRGRGRRRGSLGRRRGMWSGRSNRRRKEAMYSPWAGVQCRFWAGSRRVRSLVEGCLGLEGLLVI
jgi:hypothetical protein